jgi:aminoglycoside phosphotransferase (APT) family kinase protein
MVFAADTYSQPEAPDPVLSEDTVVAVATQHVSGARHLLEVDESGGEARAYMLSGGVVVKTQRPHRLRPRTSLTKEAFFLNELHRTGNFPVPKVLGYGHVEAIEYLCLTRIPGIAVRHVQLTPAQQTAMLHALGTILRSIHDIDQTTLRASGQLPGDEHPSDLRQRFSDAFARLASVLSADHTWQGDLDIRNLADRQIGCLPDTTQPVALHSNPGPEHVFVDPSTGRLTGLIDFGDAYRSHPAMDLRPWRQPADTKYLIAGYQAAGPLPDGFTQVVITGQIVAELSRVTRGAQDPQSAAANIRHICRTA